MLTSIVGLEINVRIIMYNDIELGLMGLFIKCLVICMHEWKNNTVLLLYDLIRQAHDIFGLQTRYIPGRTKTKKVVEVEEVLSTKIWLN